MSKKWGYAGHLYENISQFIRWLICSAVIGVVVGLVGTLFNYMLDHANAIRTESPAIIYLLPVGGIFIVFLYCHILKEKDRGTNLVIDSMSSNEEISPRLAPLIFIGTGITQLFGGSAGREGAALQIGGSMGTWLSKLLRLKEADQNVFVMCGMSACFASVFGTPLAAAIFPMEVVSIGVMYYASLVPCVCSAYVGYGVASYFGYEKADLVLKVIPVLNGISIGQVIVVAIAGALISGLFCYILHWVGYYTDLYIKNSYIRVFAGGLLIILITVLTGTQDCNGTGLSGIIACVKGDGGPWWYFLIKIVLTAVTLGVGYKGGEIVPSMFIGATLGYTVAGLIGLNPAFGAAVGLLSVFCGVTNCPITSLLIGFELFWFDGALYLLMAIAISYTLSGYYGLYDSQKIVYSKFKTKYVNRKINNHMEELQRKNGGYHEENDEENCKNS